MSRNIGDTVILGEDGERGEEQADEEGEHYVQHKFSVLALFSFLII